LSSITIKKQFWKMPFSQIDCAPLRK
jgi:hypothetical protein